MGPTVGPISWIEVVGSSCKFGSFKHVSDMFILGEFPNFHKFHEFFHQVVPCTSNVDILGLAILGEPIAEAISCNSEFEGPRTGSCLRILGRIIPLDE